MEFKDNTTCPVCGEYMQYTSQGIDRLCEACDYNGPGISYDEFLKQIEDRMLRDELDKRRKMVTDSADIKEVYICPDCGAIYPQELVFIPITCTSCKKGKLEYRIYRMVYDPIWYKPWTWFSRKAEFMLPGMIMAPTSR